MKLAHISAICSSRENADRFYRDIVKLEPVKDFSIDNDLTQKIFGVDCGCQIIVYSSENFSIEVFIPESRQTTNNPFVHHCLEISDKDAFLNSCQDAGLTVNYVPKGNKTLTFVADFDGNLFEIV